MNLSQPVSFVTKLGFTELEAKIYIFLLQSAPSTGYKIAKGIGATNASTYKAIESLEAKGAVLVEDAQARLCRAVPYPELLDQLESRFHNNCRDAEEELSKLSTEVSDNRIYQIKTIDQVYAKCRSMLNECKNIALVDLFPQPMEILRDSIIQTAARGVKIIAQTYQPMQLDGIETIEHFKGEEVIARWPVQWISLIVDAQQYIIAGIDDNIVHQAVWSASPFMAWTHFSYAIGEIQASDLKKMICDTDDVLAMREKVKYYDKISKNPAIPGYISLFEELNQNK